MSSPMYSPLEPPAEACTLRPELILDVLEEERKDHNTWICLPTGMVHKVAMLLFSFVVCVLCLLALGTGQDIDLWTWVDPIVAFATKAIVPAILMTTGLLIILMVGTIAPLRKNSFLDALRVSADKLNTLLMGILIPAAVVYVDVTFDIAVEKKFWQKGDTGYFTLNLTGIIGGLVCGAVLAQQHHSGMYRAAIIVLAMMQLLPLAVLCLAVYHFVTAERGSSSSVGFQQKLAALGVWAVLAAGETGESLCESLITTGVQVYSIVHDVALFKDVTILLSVAMGSISLAKAYTSIDVRGHVSRYVALQPVVVGVAKPASLAIAATFAYRLSSICSRMLLLSLFQQIMHEECMIYGKAYAGVLLWCLDLVFQVVMVATSTGNPWKVGYAIPNTISASEPLLIPGGPYLTVKATHVAAIHVMEGVAAIFVVMKAKGVQEIYKTLHHPALQIYLLTGSSILSMLLLLLIKSTMTISFHPCNAFSTKIASLLEDQGLTDWADQKMPSLIPVSLAFISIASTTAGGCKLEQVIHLMSDHLSERSLQMQGCKSLRIYGIDADNNKRIGEQGGIHVVLEAMKEHKASAAVQEEGCWALAHLARNDENQKRIAEQGGIQVVLGSMKEHKASAAVQQKCCWALANLARNDENQKRIAEQGGIQVVLGSMKEHKGSAAVQEQGCRILSYLGYNDEQNPERIAEQGGIQVVLGSMKKHKDSAAVQEQGCLALRALACNDENQKRIGEQGGIQVVFEAMKEHKASAAVQECGCKALAYLAYNAENEKRIAEQGGIQMM